MSAACKGQEQKDHRCRMQRTEDGHGCLTPELSCSRAIIMSASERSEPARLLSIGCQLQRNVRERDHGVLLSYPGGKSTESGSSAYARRKPANVGAISAWSVALPTHQTWSSRLCAVKRTA